MATELMRSNSTGIAFLVSAGIVYEIIAAACSSPQTTEINASSRADTLMKWVYLGLLQSAFFIFAAAFYDAEHRVPIVAGGVTAGFLMWIQYVHAKDAGLNSNKPGTES